MLKQAQPEEEEGRDVVRRPDERHRKHRRDGHVEGCQEAPRGRDDPDRKAGSLTIKLKLDLKTKLKFKLGQGSSQVARVSVKLVAAAPTG